ncbi:hypothetical protein IMCC3317_34480 [Kordia antarctica]|uniref:DNA-invertase hin n=1 Tax=Kordia antarctica TaxID=1218801 RepID=A0A7L4ZQB9_9FLAO|nr:recombinase family protein [Kordia antarctica]QHI38064.1 hypothetical protein IMCC3317_34480 [Kordia antarctica]
MNNVYGYIRVSDKKQEKGVSFAEQRRILAEYAKANNLTIIHFYKETKTAAKRGRPFFNEMMENLKLEKASGVIIHKIDRSARNLHDWADIGDLIDNNIQVYFAHENLNLNERGGRLSADIQAVMASDYVRNLRQEIVKGMYGRLKQGMYPWGAPVGYMNNGKGKIKTIDPIKAPLVKEVFKLYLSESYNIITLAEEMKKRGLRNTAGNFVDKNSIITILKNPFYIGIMQVKGQTFTGKHESLISTKKFEQAQLILKARDRKGKGLKHFYLFRKLLKCKNCNATLCGERQKGRIYYRCQRRECPNKGIREDTVEFQVKNKLKEIALHQSEVEDIGNILDIERKNFNTIKQSKLSGYKLQLHQLQNQEEKLLDAYLDNVIEKNDYQKRKKKLLIKLQGIEECISNINTETEKTFKRIEEVLELCYEPLKLYNSSIIEEKREYLKNVISNFEVTAKKVYFSMCSPYDDLAKRHFLDLCAHNQDTQRTSTLQIDHTNKALDIPRKAMKKKEVEEFVHTLMRLEGM